MPEPVAWRAFDGEGGYDYRSYEDNEGYAADWALRNPRHVGWVESLITTASAQAYAEALAASRVERAVAAKQAQIDRLTLEHCPAEMMAQQMAEWAKHQQSIPPDIAAILYANLSSLYIEDQPPATGKEPTK